ncbi:MAG: serine/threonine protein kinase, partial [Planctomycetota bacterium]
MGYPVRRMPQINFSKRTLTCKLVYFGPGLSGKTSNLEYVYGQLPPARRGELTSIATHGDRTIFYDFLPLETGKVGGLTTRLQLYTVPGQPYYAATRKLVLVGVDGVVFVADSQRARLEENRASLAELEDALAEQGKSLASLPLVFQWNKRDLSELLSVEELERALNPAGAPSFESVASTGRGVLPTLRRLSRLVLRRARAEYGGAGKARSPAAPAAPPTGVASLPTSEDTRPIPPVRPLLPSRGQVSADTPTVSVAPDEPLASSAEGEGELSAEEPEERAIGQTVGGCTILAKLGEGGMGAIYLARHPVLNKDFVVKTLKPERTKNKVSVKRFFAEARATARLEHENVVRVQDVGTTEEGMHYMIMQYIDGQNLEDRVRSQGPPGSREATRIVLEVARALEATHRAGVIHRDVKPQNIIVTQSGDVKLIDFGLARDVQEKQRLTRPGGLVGTPAYMAPEMVAGDGEVDGRVDIFALGLTYYFLLTGETPFLGADIHDLFLGKARLRAPELYADDILLEQRMVLERMLAKDRGDRYRSAADLAADLQRLLRGEPISTSNDPPSANFWLWEGAPRLRPLPSPAGAETTDLTPAAPQRSADGSARRSDGAAAQRPSEPRTRIPPP